MPLDVPDVDHDELIELMYRDKKVERGKLRFVLPTRMGHVELVRDVETEDILAATGWMKCDCFYSFSARATLTRERVRAMAETSFASELVDNVRLSLVSGVGPLLRKALLERFRDAGGRAGGESR